MLEILYCKDVFMNLEERNADLCYMDSDTRLKYR